MGVIGRQYDSLGRSSGFAFGSDYAVTYAYDGVSRFSSLTSDLGTPTSAFSYSYLHNSGLLAGWGNGTIQAMRKYEPNRDLLVAVTNLAGESLVSAFDYQNDAVGRRTQRHDQFGPVPSEVDNVFHYNSRSELITADMGVNHYGYAYDPIGNRTSSTNNDDTTTYTANQLNQYTAISDGVTIVPAYDLDGNLTNDSHFYYTWDGENRLVLASNATTVVSNSYDYMSRRVRKSVFTKDSESWPRTSDACFEYDGWNLISETISNQESVITNSYVWGLDLAEQSGAGVPRHSAPGATAGGIGGLLSVTRHSTLGTFTYYPCYDANGNITDYVDASGAVIAHREYDVYGNTVVADGAMVNDFSFWFSTKYLDADTGLYYYGYRFYNSSLGCWLSRDPIGEEGFELTAQRVKSRQELMAVYDEGLKFYSQDLGSSISPAPALWSGGLNIYGFVWNSPTRFEDPFGLAPQFCGIYNGMPIYCRNPPPCWNCPPGGDPGAECLNAPGLPADSPECDKYGDRRYMDTSLKCFCKCAGDSDWSKNVRGCLRCMDAKGVNPWEAHKRCYQAASDAGHDRPDIKLGCCYIKCLYRHGD